MIVFRLPSLQLWSPSQRRGLWVVLTILIVIFGIRLAINRATLPDPLPANGINADQLADRIDPNTATLAQIAEIPEIGDARAAAIVEYRQRFLADHPGEIPFKKLADMERVRGIGPALSEQMEPYLMFNKSISTRP